uniref:Glomulin-like n=1 Tax=Stegastes partitus TaxID=144197 RepID=A0A3B5A1L0_9TELE
MSEDQANDIIQRWVKDLKPADYQMFKNLGCACLTEGDGEQLLKFIQDEKNQVIVTAMGYVLMEPLISEATKKKKNLDHCRAAVTHLIKTCSPNDLLHSLLEVIEDVDPGAISDTILVLIPHLQTVLLRLDERKAASVGLALSALQKQLSRLPVPYSRQQEEADEFGLCRCCTALAAFTKPFIEEVKRKDGKCVATAEDEELKTEILKFYMKSLREPLLEAELTGDRKSPLWLFAVEIMPLSGLLFFSSQRKSSLMDSSQSNESKACLAYLLFVQLVTIDSFPAVFSPVFVLQRNMEYIDHLLSRYALFTKSLESIQDNSLPVSLLEQKSFFSVLQVRKAGHQTVKPLKSKRLHYSVHRSFFFCRCMLKTSNHAGVESYIVKNIKNQIESSMKPGNANKWFLGAELLSLLGLVLCLPQGAETDLLNSMDKIMESLNLLRYVLIRDKDLRNVWEDLCRIKDEYIKMLRVCIGISRAYYSSELKALKEDQKLKAKEARDAARSSRSVKNMTVKHEKVSNMSPEVQHQVLQSAMVTFDLMESLIVRIEEITEEKQSKVN